MVDFLSLGASIVDTVRDPGNPWNWAALAGDAMGAALPIIPAPGTIARATKVLDRMGDAAGDASAAAAHMVGPIGDAGALGLSRVDRFVSLSRGFSVAGETYTINSHLINSVRKSQRRDIDPESMIRALMTKGKPARPGSREFIDPKTGNRFFVNDSNAVVGVWRADWGG